MTEKARAEKQVKSRKRVADHGEVFTAQREVNAMLDLVKQETERIDSRFLEPACGDGNFLDEILRRKLVVVKERYGRQPADYEKYAFVAVTSIYGVELLPDNVVECRERLFRRWDEVYTAACGDMASDACRDAVRFVLARNILCGDALTLLASDGQPIIFSEWSLVTGNLIKRRDFRLDVLMGETPDKGQKGAQLSVFEEDANNTVNWEQDPETGKPIPRPVAEYPLTEYRRVHLHE